jgi:PhnB protein
MSTTPYLIFSGNSEAALEHYRDALGGELEIARYNSAPDGSPVEPEWSDKVMHGSLRSPLGNVNAMDAPPDRAGTPGDNFAIGIRTEDEDQAAATFSKLARGGTVIMPFEKTFFASKFGMCADKFGIKWLVQVGS